MKYFGTEERPVRHVDPSYVPMAEAYWGPGPLPEGAKIIGGYSDVGRAGALIQLANKALVCGNAGALTTIAL